MKAKKYKEERYKEETHTEKANFEEKISENKHSGEEIILQAEDLWFTYEEGGEPSLRGVSLKMRKGAKLAFMGANGSGKSTFFLCLNGINRPDKGTLYLHGEPVEYSKKGMQRLRSAVGIVFQDPDNQLFSASVVQEISFGILNQGVPQAQARAEVDRVIEQLEITPFRDRPTHALSGGQKKQVSIADILVMHPEVVILDEPAAALDPKHTRVVNALVDRLAEEGITILMATHDINYACGWADEIILMKDGNVLKQGTPAEVCADREALKATNLEEPSALRLYRSLAAKGILEETAAPPMSVEELEKRIQLEIKRRE